MLYNVLIADDEPAVLAGMERIIDWESLDLHVAASVSCGTEALPFIENDSIDILITDIRMPHMDGLALIQEIRSRKKNLKCIVMSGYDDFKYVKEAARLGIENYLLKPLSETELTSTLVATIAKIQSEQSRDMALQEGIGVLRDNILFRWASGTIEENELRDRAAFLGIELSRSKFYIVTLHRPFCVDHDSHASHNTWSATARAKVEQALKGLCLYYAFLDPEGDVCILFLDTTDSQDGFILRNLLPTFLEKRNPQGELNEFATVGSAVSHFSDVPKSYALAKRLKEYHLVLPDCTVITSASARTANTIMNPDTTRSMEFLASAIMKGDEDATRNWIDVLFASSLQSSFATPASLRAVATEALVTMMNSARSLHVDLNSYISSADPLKQIQQIHSSSELRMWMKSTSQYIIKKIAEQNAQSNTLFDRMIAYMQANYGRDINLQILASDLHSNAAYLGQLFKKESGISFSTYLNDFRVSKAVELLENSRLRISEIAEQVGYSNLNYFYAIFKKVTNRPISDYRDVKKQGPV